MAQADKDLFIQLSLAESKCLCEMDGDANPPFRSTFVVLDSKLDLDHFMHIAGKAQQLGVSHNVLHPYDPTKVAMIMFHPEASHPEPPSGVPFSKSFDFTLRAPRPMLQLLRNKDLKHVEQEWTDMHDGDLREHIQGGNQRRLLLESAAKLQALLERCGECNFRQARCVLCWRCKDCTLASLWAFDDTFQRQAFPRHVKHATGNFAWEQPAGNSTDYQELEAWADYPQ